MMVDFPSTVATRDGMALVTRHWPLAGARPAPGVAVLVHGLGEHIGRYEHVAQHLNQQGWAVVGYDHRGHGHSPGKRGALRDHHDLLHDLAAVIDATRQAYPTQALVIVGHSLGGAIAARFAAAHASPAEATPWARPIDGLVLSSPALAIPIGAFQRLLLATIGQLTPDVAVSNGLQPAWICHNRATVAAYQADPLVHDRVTGRLTSWLIEAGQTVRTRAAQWQVPTLIMWGGEDRCVDPAGSAAFAASAPRDRVASHPWPHLSHEIFNEVEQADVLAAMSGWLQSTFPAQS